MQTQACQEDSESDLIERNNNRPRDFTVRLSLNVLDLFGNRIRYL